MSALPPPRPQKHNITGWVLAGGQGLRMHGQDKGLVSFQGQPLFQRAVDRLLPQVAKVCVNANRNLTQYQTSGCEVVSDGTTTSQGPLAGFLTGLRTCPTEWLMTVACDTPFFPRDLVSQLAACAQLHQARLVMAQSQDPLASDPEAWHFQPVFCLMHRSLAKSLADFLNAGGHKVTHWATQQTGFVACPIATIGRVPHPFANANTLEDLQSLQTFQD